MKRKGIAPIIIVLGAVLVLAFFFMGGLPEAGISSYVIREPNSRVEFSNVIDKTTSGTHSETWIQIYNVPAENIAMKNYGINPSESYFVYTDTSGQETKIYFSDIEFKKKPSTIQPYGQTIEQYEAVVDLGAGEATIFSKYCPFSQTADRSPKCIIGEKESFFHTGLYYYYSEGASPSYPGWNINPSRDFKVDANTGFLGLFYYCNSPNNKGCQNTWHLVFGGSSTTTVDDTTTTQGTTTTISTTTSIGTGIDPVDDGIGFIDGIIRWFFSLFGL